MKVLHVYSGGLDSTVLLFHLREEGFDVRCVNFAYGSRHNARERAAAEWFCEHWGIVLWEVGLPLVGFRSALLEGGDAVPEGHYQEESMKQTVVPFRNGLLLSYAAGIAESQDCAAVAIAAHAGDHAIYPDCRPTFLEAMGEAIALGTWASVRLLAPFQGMTKTDIVREGARLGVPMERTWTCYKGGERHCGKCGACTERREAFREAGVADGTEYLV